MAAQETLLNNRYRLLAQQGSGGMAVIYKAIDQELGRTVAVKILRPSLITDPAFLQRFRNEARSVANLNHPNIVTLYDFRQDGNTYYIIMEFVEGQDLKKLIRSQAPFTVDRALNIAIQICAGIGYAHRAGLVHADVKPQNVLVTEEDQVKVTDFGIAQALSDAATSEERQKVVWGSPHYFSPEQAQGERPTPASDVYSVGIVLFEMLTGRMPFIGSDQQELALAHIRDAPPRVTDLNPAVPVQLEQIILKVMSKEPAARYRTADQLGRILISYRDQGHQATSGFVAPVGPRSGEVRPTASPPTQPSLRPYATVAASAQTVSPTAPTPPGPMPAAPPPFAAPSRQPVMQPDYSLPEASGRDFDAVTLILGLIAAAAVVGLILLWWQVYRLWFAA